MWKMGMSEAGADTLLSSMAAETMAGQPELAVAELAILGFIIGAKKITQHHRQKKEAQRGEQQRQADERQRQADEQARAEAQQLADENARIQAEAEARQRALEEEQQRQIEEAKQHQIQVHNENQEVIQQSVNAEYGRVENVEYQREQRLEMMEVGNRAGEAFEIQYDEDEDYQPYQPWRMPDNLPDGGGAGGNGGGGNGGGDDFVILDPEGQPARNQYQNPFWEMIGKASASIAYQALMQKQQDEEEQKKITEDLPENPTEDEKLQKDIAEQAHKDADQITENQAIIQQQMLDVLTGLGEEELTLEQSLVELDKIEADLNRLLSSQVKTTSVYSSSIKNF